MSGVGKLVSSDGEVFFEVPTCVDHFVSCDYTVLFEEHTMYFTQETIKAALVDAGWRVATQTTHPMAIEDAMSVIAQPNNDSNLTMSVQTIAEEISRFQSFAEGFLLAREQVQVYLSEIIDSGGRLAIFGAGHHGITFVNLLGLAHLVSAFIDDNEYKQQLCAPGSRLPILPSDKLMTDHITHCVLAVAQENESKVRGIVENKSPDTSCYSVFVESEFALPPFRSPSWVGQATLHEKKELCQAP